jgi:hypothetical protein
MTKFRSNVMPRMWRGSVFLFALLLAACASYGEPADIIAYPSVAAAYIPLEQSNLFTERAGAAVVIAPGIAVTNAHNSNLIDAKSVIAALSDYDLLYFHTSKTAVAPVAAPYDGERVVAYGQGDAKQLRKASGIVKRFWPVAFGYLADAGPGFSGGPVVDEKTGALVGITYGYLDDTDASGRLMTAYTTAFVLSEMREKIPGP